MILFIDTTDFNQIHFALTDGKKLLDKKFKIAYNENWKTLDHLEKFLKENKISLTPTLSPSPFTLSKILVCSGPGSFTGTRVGVTIAQGLSFANKIPLFAISKEELPKNLKNLIDSKLSKKIEITYTASKFDQVKK